MYELYSPALPLRPYIENYWAIQAQGPGLHLDEAIFVDGRADILFNFGVPYDRRATGETSDVLARSNLDGQRHYPVAIAQSGAVNLLGVRFRPGGVSAFVRLPASHVADVAVDLDLIFGRKVRDLEAKLYDASDRTTQVCLLDAFFLSQLRLSPQYEVSLALASAIEKGGGLLSIQHLCRESGYSIRAVDRLFRQHIGLTPKFYARVVRFQQVLGLLATAPSLAWLAQQTGYYDQSHFNRDFLALAGQTPEQYRQYWRRRQPEPPPNFVQFLQDAPPERP